MMSASRRILLPYSLLRQYPSARVETVRHASTAYSDDELKAARSWLAGLGDEIVPRNICEISFSRSSGPGGQNVNKVNSKATLRIPLDQLLARLPIALHDPIRASRYCKSTSNTLVIQSDDSRKQSDNTESCFVKLRSLVAAAGKEAIPGETSPGQRQRVKALEKSANEGRLRAKKMASSKKSARRSGAGRGGD